MNELLAGRVKASSFFSKQKKNKDKYRALVICFLKADYCPITGDNLGQKRKTHASKEESE